jgi:hypothetical protein
LSSRRLENNLYIYFRDWLANGTVHWEHSIAPVLIARAPIGEGLAAALGTGFMSPHASNITMP